MSVLIIGPEEENRIAAAVAAARETPVPVKILLAVANEVKRGTPLLLRDRKAGVEFVRERYKSQNVMLGTYRCAISFEEHPEGLMWHLSVSTRKGRIPGLEVMAMVIPAFGFSGFPLQRPANVWNEEFEPGWFAINVVELEESSTTDGDHQ